MVALSYPQKKSALKVKKRQAFVINFTTGPIKLVWNKASIAKTHFIFVKFCSGIKKCGSAKLIEFISGFPGD